MDPTSDWCLDLPKVFSAFREFLRDRFLCDVVLHFEAPRGRQDNAFYAHKVILMASCPHFRNLFNQGQTGEKHFRLPPGIDTRAFQIILGYLYGSDIKDQVEALSGEGLSAAAPACHSRSILDNLIDSAKILGLDHLFSKVDRFRRRQDEIAAAEAAASAAATLAPPPPPPQSTDASSESRDERFDDDDDVDDDDNSDTYSLPTQVPLDLYPQSVRKRAQCSKPNIPPPPSGIRLDLQNQYIKDLGEDKSDKNVRLPNSEAELNKYLRPHNVLKVKQRFSEKERNTPLKEAVSYDAKKKDFSTVDKLTIGLKASQVWPWKATEVQVQGQCKTESDFVNRKGKMNKTKIKVSIKWFNRNSGGGCGEEGEGKGEEGKEKEAGPEGMDGNGKEGKEDEQPEEDLGDKEKEKKTKKKLEENYEDTLIIHCNQAARSFFCPLCQDEIKHKFHFAGHLALTHGLIWKNQVNSCNFCSFITTRKALINTHAERVHGVSNPEKKQILCRFCGNSYSNSSSVKVHETICSRKQNRVPVREESGFIHFEEEEEEEVDDDEEDEEGSTEERDGAIGADEEDDAGRLGSLLSIDMAPGSLREGRIDGGTEGGKDDPYGVKIKIEEGHYDSAMVKLERLEEEMLDADGNLIPGEISQYLVDHKQMIADLLPRKRKLKQKRDKEKEKPKKQKQKRVVKKIKTIKAYDYGKEFLCPICGKSLKGSQLYKKHLLEHNGVTRPRFPCQEEGCGFTCGNNLSLVSHLYSIHKINIESREILHCPYCDYTTLLKPVLKRHLDFHENKRSFVCDIPGCDMAFNAKGTLLRHKAGVHDKSNKVNCPFCGVEFHLKTRLQQHIKLMHTERGVKNWKCGYCAHASALRGNCRKHQKNEHKGMKEWIVDLRKEKPTVVNQQLETAFPQMRKLVY